LEKTKSGSAGLGVAIVPLPFSPVGFSGETMRDSEWVRSGSAAIPVWVSVVPAVSAD
jgi:hypothetical protein